MRARLVFLAAALGILALQWTREPGFSLAPAVPEATSSGEPAWSSRAVGEPTPWPVGGRDPFRFQEPPTLERGARRPAVSSGEMAPLPSPAPPVRLVGFVRRSGRLEAALAAEGEVVLASVGDRIGAFTLVALDPLESVRLRGADGSELTLTLAEAP